MALILQFILKLPAWIILLITGIVVYFGTPIFMDLNERKSQLLAAAQATPAELVDFDDSSPARFGEIAIRANAFDDASYQFWYGDGGRDDYTEYFLFLEEPSAKTTDRKFSAVLIFTSENADRISEWWKSVLVNPARSEDLAAIRGFATRSDLLGAEAAEALYALGGKRSENFVYIRPFIDGRDAYYQNAVQEADLMRYGLGGVVGILLLWAVLRQLIGNRFKKAAVKPSGAKTAMGFASAAVGIAGLGGEEEEEDSLLDDDAALVLSIGKTIFGFLWKRRESKRTAQSTKGPEAVATAVLPAAPQPMTRKAEEPQAIYSPFRQLYDEDGLPIDRAALRASA